MTMAFWCPPCCGQSTFGELDFVVQGGSTTRYQLPADWILWTARTSNRHQWDYSNGYDPSEVSLYAAWSYMPINFGISLTGRMRFVPNPAPPGVSRTALSNLQLAVDYFEAELQEAVAVAAVFIGPNSDVWIVAVDSVVSTGENPAPTVTSESPYPGTSVRRTIRVSGEYTLRDNLGPPEEPLREVKYNFSNVLFGGTTFKLDNLASSSPGSITASVGSTSLLMRFVASQNEITETEQAEAFRYEERIQVLLGWDTSFSPDRAIWEYQYFDAIQGPEGPTTSTFRDYIPSTLSYSQDATTVVQQIVYTPSENSTLVISPNNNNSFSTQSFTQLVGFNNEFVSQEWNITLTWPGLEPPPIAAHGIPANMLPENQGCVGCGEGNAMS